MAAGDDRDPYEDIAERTADTVVSQYFPGLFLRSREREGKEPRGVGRWFGRIFSPTFHQTREREESVDYRAQQMRQRAQEEYYEDLYGLERGTLRTPVMAPRATTERAGDVMGGVTERSWVPHPELPGEQLTVGQLSYGMPPDVDLPGPAMLATMWDKALTIPDIFKRMKSMIGALRRAGFADDLIEKELRRMNVNTPLARIDEMTEPMRLTNKEKGYMKHGITAAAKRGEDWTEMMRRAGFTEDEIIEHGQHLRDYHRLKDVQIPERTVSASAQKMIDFNKRRFKHDMSFEEWDKLSDEYKRDIVDDYTDYVIREEDEYVAFENLPRWIREAPADQFEFFSPILDQLRWDKGAFGKFGKDISAAYNAPNMGKAVAEAVKKALKDPENSIEAIGDYIRSINFDQRMDILEDARQYLGDDLANALDDAVELGRDQWAGGIRDQLGASMNEIQDTIIETEKSQKIPRLDVIRNAQGAKIDAAERMRQLEKQWKWKPGEQPTDNQIRQVHHQLMSEGYTEKEITEAAELLSSEDYAREALEEVDKAGKIQHAPGYTPPSEEVYNRGIKLYEEKHGETIERVFEEMEDVLYSEHVEGSMWPEDVLDNLKWEFVHKHLGEKTFNTDIWWRKLLNDDKWTARERRVLERLRDELK